MIMVPIIFVASLIRSITARSTQRAVSRCWDMPIVKRAQATC